MSSNQEGFTEVFGFAGSKHPPIVENISTVDPQAVHNMVDFTQKVTTAKISQQRISKCIQAVKDYFNTNHKVCVDVVNTLEASEYSSTNPLNSGSIYEMVFLVVITDATTPYAIVVYTKFSKDNTLISIISQPQEHTDYHKRRINPPYDENIHDFPSFDAMESDLFKIFKTTQSDLITDSDLSKRIHEATSHIDSSRVAKLDVDHIVDKFTIGAPITNTSSARSTMATLNAYRDSALTSDDINDILIKWRTWNPTTKQYDRINDPNNITSELLTDMIDNDSCGGENVLHVPYDKLSTI